MRHRGMAGLAVALALVVGAAPLPETAAAAQDPVAGGPLGDSRQVVLVLTDGWDAVNGVMQRFERDTPAGPWRRAGGPVPIVVGRTGLAWGLGLAAAPAGGPVKREGDGKAPAGVFALSTAFGQSKEKPADWQMPYRYLDDNVECVDDAGSESYNRLATRRAGEAPRWTSSERMWLEPLYRWGVVVDHNLPAPAAGGGSCIFLHVWKGPDHGTAGCTAMEESALTAAIAWLTPASRPRLVQLPRVEYDRLKGPWKLPALQMEGRDSESLP